MKMTEKKAELTITPEESGRISILKMWLSVMVVFLHSYKPSFSFAGGIIAADDPAWLDNIKYIISQILTRCAVPAFFFLAAYFLYRKPFSWGKNVAKKARSLLVPYFILNTFWIAAYYTGQHIPALSAYFSNPDFMVAGWDLERWISAYFGSPSSQYPLLHQLWFIRDLFILNLIPFVFEWMVRILRHFALAVFIAAWLLVESTHVFFLDIQGICFWGIGCYFAYQRKPVSSFDRYRTVAAAAYPVLVAAAFLLRDRPGTGPLAVHRLCVLAGLVFWFAWTTKIKNGKVRGRLLSVSKYSFCIFLFHEMNLTFLQKILTRVLPQTPVYAVILYFAVPVVIIFFCILLSYLLEKYIPPLYRLVSGGRTR